MKFAAWALILYSFVSSRVTNIINTLCFYAGRIDLQDTVISESEQKPETWIRTFLLCFYWILYSIN